MNWLNSLKGLSCNDLLHWINCRYTWFWVYRSIWILSVFVKRIRKSIRVVYVIKYCIKIARFRLNMTQRSLLKTVKLIFTGRNKTKYTSIITSKSYSCKEKCYVQAVRKLGNFIPIVTCSLRATPMVKGPHDAIPVGFSLRLRKSPIKAGSLRCSVFTLRGNHDLLIAVKGQLGR